MTKIELGGVFFAWLKAAIYANRLRINDANAKVHVVDGQLLVVSWNNYVRHLRALFNHGMDQGLLPYTQNPFLRMTVTAPKKPKKTLEADQIRKVFALFEELEWCEYSGDFSGRLHPVWFWRAVVATFYFTGMRLNQLLHLTALDIDRKRLLIRIRVEGSKTHREYSVPICEELRPLLRQVLDMARRYGIKPSEQLFNINRYSASGRHTRQTMNNYQLLAGYTDMSKRLGFRVSPHRFRHTLGTDLMNRPDANLHLVKELLGHTNLSTTLEYIQPDVEQIRDALEKRQQPFPSTRLPMISTT